MRVPGILLTLVLAAPVASFAGTVYYLTTSQAGANTTIDATHEMTWSATAPTCFVANCTSNIVSDFTPSFDWQIGGGIFTIKSNSADQGITFDLWDVTTTPLGGTLDAPTGDLVASISLAASDPSILGAYTPTDFFFASPVTLVQGDIYVATLTSTAGEHGNTQYDIKGYDQTTIQDSTGGTGNQLTDTSTVPEPSSWAMMAGAVLLGAAFRFKRAGAV